MRSRSPRRTACDTRRSSGPTRPIATATVPSVARAADPRRALPSCPTWPTVTVPSDAEAAAASRAPLGPLHVVASGVVRSVEAQRFIEELGQAGRTGFSLPGAISWLNRATWELLPQGPGVP